MRINVHVHPNSKKPGIEKDSTGNVHVYVKEPARGGQANTAAVHALSDLYKVPKYQIELITGVKSKFKIFNICIE